MAANPIDYVNMSLPGKHIVLLHEDPKYAQLIEFSYLLHGLRRKDVCVYLTYDDERLAEKMMMERGLDFARFDRRAQLYILRITDEPFNLWQVIEQLRDDTNKSFSFDRCRIVWRFDRKQYDENQLLAHIEEDSEAQSELERDRTSPTGHHLFNYFKGTILCSYPLNDLSLSHPHIIRHHLNNHHAIILAPKHGEGAVLQSDGLQKSDMEDWIRNRLGI